MATDLDPRTAELSEIDAWLAEHDAITKIDRPKRRAADPVRKFGAGRPPKAGDRYACGKLRPVAATATDEHQAKRRALVGEPRRARTPQEIAKHEALAASPLGVLYARGLILSGDHYAARRYAMLFASAVRPLSMPSVLGNLVAGGGHTLAMALLDEMAGQERHPVTGALVPIGTWDREQFLDAHDVLESRGAHVVRAVEALVIYENPPRGQRRLDAIRDGLDALKTHFDGVDERAAR